jgi:hypothetical protein
MADPDDSRRGRPLTDVEVRKANDKHAKPEFLPAGKGPDGENLFVMIVGEDGLKRLRDDDWLSKEQYDRIRNQIPAEKETAWVGLEGRNPSTLGRYLIMFEGKNAQTASPTGVMSGQLEDVMYTNPGDAAPAIITFNNQIDLRWEGEALRSENHNYAIGLDTHFNPKVSRKGLTKLDTELRRAFNEFYGRTHGPGGEVEWTTQGEELRRFMERFGGEVGIERVEKKAREDFRQIEKMRKGNKEEKQDPQAGVDENLRRALVQAADPSRQPAVGGSTASIPNQQADRTLDGGR